MNSNQSAMLNELLNDDSDKMSEWEVGFIESMDVKRSDDLSEAQENKLRQIWERVFG